MVFRDRALPLYVRYLLTISLFAYACPRSTCAKNSDLGTNRSIWSKTGEIRTRKSHWALWLTKTVDRTPIELCLKARPDRPAHLNEQIASSWMASSLTYRTASDYSEHAHSNRHNGDYPLREDLQAHILAVTLISRKDLYFA